MKEGRKDCVTERILSSCLVLVFSASLLFSQNRIDNFAFLHSIKTAPGYAKLSAIDFNEDGVTDYILFGIDKKEVVIHRSLKDGKLSAPINKFFYYPVTDIKYVNKREDFGSFYIVISEKNRLAALTSFTKYGTMLMLNKHKFEYSPTGLSLFDYNKDNRNEAIVYGKNFLGISLLRIDNFILKEERIADEGVFPFIETVNFDYDNFTDLLAYETLSNNLIFFQNNNGVSLSEVRRMRLPFNPQKMAVGDFNGDRFIDVAFIYDNEFTYFAGDSVSSFERNQPHMLSFTPSDFFAYDLNNDSYPDLLFITEADSSLYISFNKKGKFEEPVKLIDREKIVNIQIGDNQLYILSQNGFIFTQPFEETDSRYSIVLADDFFEEPHAVNLTNLSSLPLMRSNDDVIRLLYGKGSFNEFYDFIPSEKCERIFSLSSANNNYHFIYTPGEKCLEVIRINKNNFNVARASFFSKFNIVGLAPVYNDAAKMYIALAFKDTSGLVRTDALEFIFGENPHIETIDTSIAEAVLSEKRQFGYALWKDSKDVNLLQDVIDGENHTDTVRLMLRDNYFLATQLKGNYKLSSGVLYFWYDGKQKAKLNLGNLFENRRLEPANIKYYEIDGSAQYLFINVPELSELYYARVDLIKKSAAFKKLIDSKKINKYIVRKIYNKIFILYKEDDFNKIMIHEIE